MFLVGRPPVHKPEERGDFGRIRLPDAPEGFRQEGVIERNWQTQESPG